MIFLMSLPEGPGILLIMIAYHKAPAAALAPFWYFTTITVFLIFFGELTFPNATLIIFAGGVIIWRERHIKTGKQKF